MLNAHIGKCGIVLTPSSTFSTVISFIIAVLGSSLVVLLLELSVLHAEAPCQTIGEATDLLPKQDVLYASAPCQTIGEAMNLLPKQNVLHV